MPQKKPMSDAELAVFEVGQDFEALLVQSAREMGAGKTLIAIAEKMPEALRAVDPDYKAPRRAPGRAEARQIKT